MVHTTYGLVMHLIIIFVYCISIAYYFKIRKSMSKTIKNVIHYFMVGIFLILGLAVLHLIEIIFPILGSSVGFLQGSQMMLILAGLLFFKGLRRLYFLEVNN